MRLMFVCEFYWFCFCCVDDLKWYWKKVYWELKKDKKVEEKLKIVDIKIK